MFRRLGLFIIMPIVLVTALAAGVSAFLNHGKFARTLADVESARFALIAKGVKAGIEANLNLGLSLPGLGVAPQIIERERAMVAGAATVVVFGGDRAVLFASDQDIGFDRAPEAWAREAEWSVAFGDRRVVGMPLVNAFGTVVGGVAVLYPGDARDHAQSDMAWRLTAAAAASAAATAVLSLLALAVLLRRRAAPAAPRIRAIFVTTVAATLIAQIGMAVHAWTLFETKLTPELERKAEVIALSVGAKLTKALDIGIPFDALEGCEDYFAEIRRANPDIAFIALARADGGVARVEGLPPETASTLLSAVRPTRAGDGASWRRLPSSGVDVQQVVSVRIRPGDHASPILHVGLKQGFLSSKIAEIHLDIIVVLAISLMVALEVMRHAAANWLDSRGNMDRPAGAAPREGAFRPAMRVRLLTFLFMFAEQLSRPFLPVFADGLLPADMAARALWAGAPISAFMLAAALSMPVLAPWSDRVGRRRSFLTGALVAAAGLGGAALCFGIADFIVWRVVTALGYAMMFVACQGFVIDGTGEKDRAQGVATFVGAIMVSELCAPGIGGILADRIGERSVFAVGAAVMAGAAFVGASVMTARRGAAPVAATGAGGMFAAVRDPRFAILMLTAAVPAKLALTAFMFYLVPVGLAALGNSQAEIGRIAMLYAVPSVVAAALFARLADRMGCNGLMVGLGGMITGAGFLPILFWPDERALVVGIVALGLGQAMSISPQLAMATQIRGDAVARHGAGSVLGVYRLIERLGAASGPLVAGILTALFGPMEAAGVLGAAIFVSAVAFSVAFLVLGTRPEEELDVGAAVHQGTSP